jgi:CheY-like chemotaxis protein
MKLVRRFQPDAITLDLALPEMHGGLVMDRLKDDSATRHIPVHVVTAHDEREFSLKRGAIGFLKKPADWDELSKVFEHLRRFIETRERYLLVVEANEAERQGIAELIGNGNVHTLGVGTGAEAIETLRSNRIDCMVVNLLLPDMTGLELIKRIQSESGLEDLRIVIRATREMTDEEAEDLRQIAEISIVKEARSSERLLEEVSLFLHRPASVVRERKARIVHKDEADPLLAGKRILIIDDDVRNLFALTSLFEGHKMDALFAEGGEEGLDILDKNPNVQTVLVDIMMPGLDGFEVIRRIRSRREFADLPVIALTAKAMRDDREACIAAGATDYVAKPADTEHLLSIVRRHLAGKLRSAG